MKKQLLTLFGLLTLTAASMAQIPYTVIEDFESYNLNSQLTSSVPWVGESGHCSPVIDNAGIPYNHIAKSGCNADSRAWSYSQSIPQAGLDSLVVQFQARINTSSSGNNGGHIALVDDVNGFNVNFGIHYSPSSPAFSNYFKPFLGGGPGLGNAHVLTSGSWYDVMLVIDWTHVSGNGLFGLAELFYKEAGNASWLATPTLSYELEVADPSIIVLNQLMLRLEGFGSGFGSADNIKYKAIESCNLQASITPQGSTTFCQGGSVTLTSSSGSSYLWSNGQTSQSITVSQAGSYSVQVTDNGCSATSASTIVTVNPTPNTTITANGSTSFCSGGSVTLTAQGSGSYLWSNGQTSQSINVTQSGNYSVTVSNNGCSATSGVTTVTVNPTPTATIIPQGATTFCQGGSVVLQASGGGTYQWSTGAQTQSINVNQSGNYSVTVTDGNGCQATSSATTVTVNSTPNGAVTSNGSTTFCSGGSVTLTAQGSGSYLWSNGQTSQSINVGQSGNYSVTVSNNGCSATSGVTTVTVNPTPTATIIPQGATTFCQGGSVVLQASGGGTYQWSTGVQTQGINVNQSGNYSVTVSLGGCQASSAVTTVVVNPIPSVSLNALSNVCENTSAVLLSGGSPSGGSYTVNGNPASTLNPAQTGLGLQIVEYTYTDGNGCGNSATQSVTVNAVPNTTFGGLNSNYTINDSPSVLSGLPTGGIFNGSGVSNGIFDPADAGLGTHGIAYIYVDGNGCIGSESLCTTVDVSVGIGGGNQISNGGGVEIYPNPSKGLYSLSFEREGIVSYSVFDSRGREIVNESFVSNGSVIKALNLSDYSNGVYVIQVGTTDGVASYKLIKE